MVNGEFPIFTLGPTPMFIGILQFMSKEIVFAELARANLKKIGSVRSTTLLDQAVRIA